jgi:molybdenum cofactor cytidylyltransferase
MNTAVMILAGGAATRMGKAKMLLPHHSVTILQHLINEVNKIQPVLCLIVTGCYHEQITAQLQGVPKIQLVYNTKWATGMASSIHTGIHFLLQQPISVNNLFILVSDQPYLNASLLKNMLQLQQQQQKGIIAAEYDGVIGTPVLIKHNYFQQLLQLQGDKGARNLLNQYPNDLAIVPFPMGKFDIDTPEDYVQFSLHNQKNNVN